MHEFFMCLLLPVLLPSLNFLAWYAAGSAEGGLLVGDWMCQVLGAPSFVACDISHCSQHAVKRELKLQLGRLRLVLRAFTFPFVPDPAHLFHHIAGLTL